VTVPVFYERPQGDGCVLGVPPALASWDRSDSRGQARSAAFVAEVGAAVVERISLIPDPLALRLDIGLPQDRPLLAHNDLDNYLFPLIPRLTAATTRRFSTVWATKRHAATSSVTVCQARTVAEAPDGTHSVQVRTTASTGTVEYKQQIREQVAACSVLPEGAVAVQLAFVIGPRRVWPNLWKATIDALGPILGHEPGASEWNPRDGRITCLALHCMVDPAARHEVTIAIRAGAIGQSTTFDGFSG
jgi:hypothetical protein